MSSARYVLALDEGSSSCRAVLVDRSGRVVASAGRPVVADFPQPGWVTLDPKALWEAQRVCIEEALAKVEATTDDLAAIGVTTHRETIAVWDRSTGEPVYPFISWMSKQTDGIVEQWRGDGLDEEVRRRTGLFNDSFFSAPKLRWLLDQPGVRERAERGELAAGTVDTWLIWNLTGGRSHLTDHSEASRTALLDLDTLDWDAHLLGACGIPDGLLPPVVASDAEFGEMRPGDVGLPGSAAVPIRAVMADQQSGLFGQACFERGDTKNTFGTAGVLVANCGDRPSVLEGLTTSVAWTENGVTAYEAEGVVFHCGQTLSWMREKAGLIGAEESIDALVGSVPDTGGVYVVPAFVGMCAPHWVRDAKAAIVGVTLETDRARIVRAGLEAMAFQTADNVDALVAGGNPVPELRVDGGGARSDLLCQFQADIIGVPVLRPAELERTALGVAHLAGMGVGLWRRQDLADDWSVDRTFEPAMPADRALELRAGWTLAVQTVLRTG